MIKSKSFILTSMVMVLIAAIISLMFVAMSFANSDQDVSLESNNDMISSNDISNENFCIHINVDAASVSGYQFICRSHTEAWDPATNTFDVSKISIGPQTQWTGYNISDSSSYDPVNRVGNLDLQAFRGETPVVQVRLVVTWPENVEFSGWGTIDPSIKVESTYLNVGFYPATPVIPDDANALTVKGSVTNAPGAEVKIQNIKTGEILEETISGASGEFEFNKVPATDLAKALKESHAYALVVSFPGYAVNALRFTDEIVTDVQDKEVIYENFDTTLSVSDVNFYGLEHHQYFKCSWDAYYLGQYIEAESMKFDVSCIGFLADEMFSSDTELTIGEKGIIRCKIIAAPENADDDFYYLATFEPIIDEGYWFDYIDINSQHYKVGDVFTVKAGSDEDIYFNYTNQPEKPNPELVNEIAQTGDAFPFVALVGLGMVAVVAFVVARKQFN